MEAGHHAIEESIAIHERLDHRLHLARSLRVRADIRTTLADTTGAAADRTRADQLVKASRLPDETIG